MLIERHNTHELHSITSSSNNHSYFIETNNKIKENKNENIIKHTLSNRQINEINDILKKYNLVFNFALDSNRNNNKKNNQKQKNNEKRNSVPKLKPDISSIIGEERSSQKRRKKASIKINNLKKLNTKDNVLKINIDNSKNIKQNNMEKKSEEKKNDFEFKESSKLDINKKDYIIALSYKKTNKDTYFNNIKYEENKIKKKLRNDKKQKLLIYHQLNDSKNLLRSINKPNISFITKIFKSYNPYDNIDNNFKFPGLKINIKNNLYFVTKTIIHTKKFVPPITTEKKLNSRKIEKIKKEDEEDEKIPTFSSINTSSSNSIQNIRTKNKSKTKIKSKRKTFVHQSKISPKSIKKKKKSLYQKNSKRSVSIYSRMSGEKSETKKTAASRKSLFPLIQNSKNKDINKKYFEKQTLHTNRGNRKYSCISPYSNRFFKSINQHKKEEKDIIDNKSIRNINKFNSPFKNNLLNMNKPTEEENTKLKNNSLIQDKDKINNELDFKKFLEEQKMKRKNQIRNFMKRKGINSYNFFYPKEPSPLLGIFKNNYSVYPSLYLNSKNSIGLDAKNNTKKQINEYSSHNKKLNKGSKSYRREKISMKQINKENDEKNMNRMHIKEKHYGIEKDCPICRTFKFKIEKIDNDSDMNNTKTTKYNKLRPLSKYAGIFSPKSRSSLNSLNDFTLISRNRLNSSRKSDFLNENESFRIQKNFNVLFDYFLQ